MFNRIDANGDPHSAKRPEFWNVVTASTTLTKDDDGQIIAVGTDALVITIPAVGATTAPAGTTLTFLNIGADGNNDITLSPSGTDGIKGSVSSSAGANADATTADGLISKSSGANGKDFVNTKATANEGDRVTIVSDGIADWWIVDGIGIWASEV